MNLRIARKIVKRMGHGYPVNNIERLYKAVNIWEKGCRRFKHFKRDVTMRRKRIKL